MVDLPSSFAPSTMKSNTNTAMNFPEEDTSSISSALNSTLSSTFGSSMESSPIRTGYQNNLAGHPCATGCGHFCWATNKNGDDI